MLADYGGKDLWKRWVLSLEWNSERVTDGETGKQVEDELQSVTSSAEWFMYGWHYETGSWLLAVERRCVSDLFYCIASKISIQAGTKQQAITRKTKGALDGLSWRRFT